MTSLKRQRSTAIPDEVLDMIAEALDEAVTTALTLSPQLSDPYPDDPRWTPYTRFMEPMAERAIEAKSALRRARESSPKSRRRVKISGTPDPPLTGGSR